MASPRDTPLLVSHRPAVPSPTSLHDALSGAPITSGRSWKVTRGWVLVGKADEKAGTWSRAQSRSSLLSRLSSQIQGENPRGLNTNKAFLFPGL